MINLIEVFKEFGYATDTQHLSIVKLMAFDNGFSVGSGKESSESQIISDEAARKILAGLNFKSLAEGIDFLLTSTDRIWLRGTHQQEKVHAQNQAQNTNRWTAAEAAKYTKYREELLKLLTSINMLNHTPSWPKNENYQHVVLHGALEIPQMKERLEALESFEGTLYYLTSPRGAFNDEPSTAEIIAEWIGKPDKVDLIRKVLLEYKDSSNWLNNLAAVKKAILDITNTSSWPTNKGCYYDAPAIYQENGKDKDGKLVRDLQDWPVAADIVAHRFKKMQKARPGQFDKVKLVALPTLGKMSIGSDGKPDRKIANTDDNVELWFKEYGQKLVLEQQNNQKSSQEKNKIKVLFVTSESQREFQHKIACKYLSSEHFDVLTICKKAAEIKIDFVLDSLTRLFWVKREASLKKKTNEIGTAQPILTQAALSMGTTSSSSVVQSNMNMAKTAQDNPGQNSAKVNLPDGKSTAPVPETPTGNTDVKIAVPTSGPMKK